MDNNFYCYQSAQTVGLRDQMLARPTAIWKCRGGFAQHPPILANATATSLQCPLLTLDRQLKSVGQDHGIKILEL